jgi:hypothetical protein
MADYLLFRLNLHLQKAGGHSIRASQYFRPLCLRTEHIWDSLVAESLQHLLTSSTFPTNDIYHFLTDLAIRLGALRKGGEPDLDHAAHFFVRMWRDGKFGNWSLDNLGSEEEVEENVLALLKRPQAYSATQAKKKKRADRGKPAKQKQAKRKVRNVR